VVWVHVSCAFGLWATTAPARAYFKSRSLQSTDEVRIPNRTSICCDVFLLTTNPSTPILVSSESEFLSLLGSIAESIGDYHVSTDTCDVDHPTPMTEDDIGRPIEAFEGTLEVLRPYLVETTPHLLAG